MKLLTAAQMREADAYTIQHEPVAPVDLMERAARACVEKLKTRFGTAFRFRIFCGLGNNGGDGLAIARLLATDGYEVSVFIVRHSSKCSAGFAINEQRLKQIPGCRVQDLQPGMLPDPAGDSEKTVCIDAILGSGQHKPLEGFLADLVDHINRTKLPVIAIDVPTGLLTENYIRDKKASIIRAVHTLTFEAPRLAFMFPENGEYIGDFTVLPIGLSKAFIAGLPGKNFFLTKQVVNGMLRSRKKFDHKGTYGHALLVAGSYGKMGAAVLAAKACLRAGAGLLTVRVPRCGYGIIQQAVPEAMGSTDTCDEFISDIIHLDPFNAVGIGPGLGLEKQTQQVLKVLIQNAGQPLVLDADALNILAENKTWISFLPRGSIFTPHPKEFDRLAGKTSDSYARYKLQVEFACKYGVYVVLKGAHTAIACPDGRVYFNSTGNPGMATGGSGDVLTGILTGLLAQGYSPEEAALLGVYLHGLAGDIALAKTGGISLVAGDLTEHLQEAFAWASGK